MNDLVLAQIVSGDFPILYAHRNAMTYLEIRDKPGRRKFIYPVIAAVTGPILTFTAPAFFGT